MPSIDATTHNNVSHLQELPQCCHWNAAFSKSQMSQPCSSGHFFTDTLRCRIFTLVAWKSARKANSKPDLKTHGTRNQRKKKWTKWKVVYTPIYRVSTIQGGSGFLPSTVHSIIKYPKISQLQTSLFTSHLPPFSLTPSSCSQGHDIRLCKCRHGRTQHVGPTPRADHIHRLESMDP